MAAALKEVEATARSERNLMPAILAAVKAYATVGEVSDAFAEPFWRVPGIGCYLAVVANEEQEG